MKAIVIENYGSAEQLIEKDMPMPKINDDQVLLELKATSVNPVDWKAREGYMKEAMPLEFPVILGWDAAGIVKETGKNVTNFQPGDAVFARPATNARGTYAEYTAVDAHLLAKKPENISFEEAASIPLAGETAWVALVEKAAIKKDDRVLIHAGAGGVGSLAIQIAKSFGAYVASTASKENHDLLDSLGADKIIDYKTEDFESLLSDYDIVFDTVGGETEDKSFTVLKKGGILVSIVGTPDEEKAAEKGIRTSSFLLDPSGEILSKLGELIEKGDIKPLLGEVFPLTEEGVRKAHELSETHHAKGKIGIKINS